MAAGAWVTGSQQLTPCQLQQGRLLCKSVSTLKPGHVRNQHAFVSRGRGTRGQRWGFCGPDGCRGGRPPGRTWRAAGSGPRADTRSGSSRQLGSRSGARTPAAR